MSTLPCTTVAPAVPTARCKAFVVSVRGLFEKRTSRSGTYGSCFPRHACTPKLRLFCSLLGVILLVSPVASATVIANAPRQPGGRYSCAVGKRQATVSRAGAQLIYTFGPLGQPQIRIVGDPKAGTVSYLHSMYPHAEHQQLRFRNGDYSYVLYARWASPNVVTQTGGEDSRGLLIFNGTRRVARLNCIGDGWPADEVFGTLPSDGDDITPDPSEH